MVFLACLNGRVCPELEDVSLENAAGEFGNEKET